MSGFRILSGGGGLFCGCIAEGARRLTIDREQGGLSVRWSVIATWSILLAPDIPLKRDDLSCGRRPPEGFVAAMEPDVSNQAIIRPVRGKQDPQIGPIALMVMLSHALDGLVRKAGAVKVSFSDSALYRLYLTAGRTGPPVALAGPFFGAPHAVMGLERLIALGARKVWVLGWCGGLQKNLHIGDLVVPDHAVAEEGTSRHYPIPGNVPSADSDMKLTLKAALSRSGHRFREGTIWTTDAIYRETAGKVAHFQKEGVLAVDMEMSALMTVAAYRFTALSALLVVSDELSELKWKPGFSSPLLKEKTRLAGDLLLDLSMAATRPSTEQPNETATQ